MNFFKKIKGLVEGSHTHELAVLSGGAALLLLVAVFISGGGMSTLSRTFANIAPGSQTADIFPCSWYGDCAGAVSTNYRLSASTLSSTPGAPVSLGWEAYQKVSGQYYYHCSRDTQESCSISNYGVVGGHDMFYLDAEGNSYYNPGGCTQVVYAVECDVGNVTVYPTVTTTYTFCSYYYSAGGGGSGMTPLPCPSVTISIPSPTTPTTLTSFTATPASVATGGTTVLNWTGVRGTNFSSCMLIGGQWGSGTWIGGTIPDYTGTAPISTTTTYGVQCYDNTYGWAGPLWTTVTATGAPVSADATSNSPRTVGQTATISFHADSTTLPGPCNINNSGGVTNLYSVGSCPSSANTSYTTPAYTVPGTYTYTFYYHRAGVWTLAKTVNVTVTAVGACANGLNSSYQPSCTCPIGQTQSGAVCVATPVCTGANQTGTPPNCICEVGYQWDTSGTTCVQGMCPGANEVNWPTCSCAAGYSRDIPTSLCIHDPVLDIKVNGQDTVRVRKGNQVAVTWSASGIVAGSCRVTTNSGTTIGSKDSGSASPILSNQTTYRLGCTNEAGTAVSKEVIANLIPEVIEQ